MRGTRILIGLSLLAPLACGGGDDPAESAEASTETSSGETSSESGTGSSDESGSADQDGGDGDGDGDGSTGDGDGSTGDGDGSTGDGDGDGSTGDGDGSTGDGDGSTGDGDGSTGDGDGSTGDGDGSTGDGDGDGSTGDGDGSTGDGEGSTGDGDGSTGDGDGSTGDGDGDGDGSTGDGDGSTGDGDGSTGDGDGDGDSCFEVNFDAEPIPPNVVFVLDKSASMDDDWTTCPTCDLKWASLWDAVEFTVLNFDDLMNFGMQLFPREKNCDGSGLICDQPGCSLDPIEVPVTEVGDGALVMSTIPAPDAEVLGLTPMGAGLNQAYDHLNGLGLPGDQAVILIADGEETCGISDSDIATAVQTAKDTNDITTYVIGVDIENPGSVATFLDGLASVGGSGNWVNATDQAGLQNAISGIVGNVSTCKIPLQFEPPFPDDTLVVVNGTSYGLVTDCATETGFVYSVPYSEIEVCGNACTELGNAGTAEVQYFCDAG
jgi:hypothetical protein